MKRNLILLLSIIFLSCNQDKKEKENKSDTVTVSEPNKNLESSNDRGKIISELNRFRDAITNKNKPAILSFFDFPLVDSTVNFYEVDSIFDAKRKLNNGNITKEMFSNSFDAIYEQTDMISFKNLFKNLNTKDLEKKDNIEYTDKIKDDGCYYFYSIHIKKDEVYLQFGTNSNEDYIKTHPDEEEVCAEYAQMWTFKFEGNKLHFLKHRIAG